ncbi:hypothetical protein V5O48_009496 [Marasmius crinis-equi]|uniref:Uncharacterized protein n=1 Tax=Marasmius crinis-equi TaxID=585013 RepID=A0ABR3FBP4_9AGAR
MMDPTVLRVLRGLPDIKQLSLRGEYLFPHLFEAMASDHSLLPNLETLTLSPLPGPTSAPFEEMIRSRSSSERTVLLRSIHLETNGNSSFELAARLFANYMHRLEIYLIQAEVKEKPTRQPFYSEVPVLVRIAEIAEIDDPRATTNSIENASLLDSLLAAMEESPCELMTKESARATHTFLESRDLLLRLDPASEGLRAVKEVDALVNSWGRLSCLRGLWSEEYWRIPGLA